VATLGAFAGSWGLLGWGGATYAAFYPTVMLVGLVLGLGPGLTATGLACLLTAAWILPGVAEVAGLVVFTLSVMLMSVLAERYRRSSRGALRLRTLNEAIAVDAPVQADQRPGHWVVLAVEDTGEGLAPEARAHLFEPFFNTKGVRQGTGLGLATVRGVVTQGGGHLRVTSQPGLGTTFEVVLPRWLGAPTPAARTVEAGARRGSETVLVAPDDPQVLAVTARTLGEAGYQVLATTSGPEALAGRGLPSAGQGFLAKPFTGNDLLAAARRTLEAEDRYMASRRVPGLEAHRREQAALRAQLDLVRRRVASGTGLEEIAPAALDLLHGWLTQHVGTTDQALRTRAGPAR
jgi:membrane protein implicated in regulation of membrane protease activity